MTNVDNSFTVQSSLTQPDGVHETAASASQHQKIPFSWASRPPTHKCRRLSGEERPPSLRTRLRRPSSAAARAKAAGRAADPLQAAQTSARRRRGGGSSRAAAQCRRRPAGGSTAQAAGPQPALAAGTLGPPRPGQGGGEQPTVAALGRLAQAEGGGALPGSEEAEEKKGLPPSGADPAPLVCRRARYAAPTLILPGAPLPPSRSALRLTDES
ncbi:uncharacterized protein LJ206_010831 isoform 2-T6 [Theristicus caerulescens]